MKKMSLVVLTLIMVLSALAMPAYAAGPTPVSGTFDYSFVVDDTRSANGNTFLYATEWEEWAGDFSGQGEATFRVQVFPSGDMNVWLRSEFQGTVTGVEAGDDDKMIIQLVGEKPFGEDWSGQWVIIGGTGALAQVRGQGTWGGPGFGPVTPMIWYNGQIQIVP
jgi:hypothetical protein